MAWGLVASRSVSVREDIYDILADIDGKNLPNNIEHDGYKSLLDMVADGRINKHKGREINPVAMHCLEGELRRRRIVGECVARKEMLMNVLRSKL